MTRRIEPWQKSAACLGADVSLFVPDDGLSASQFARVTELAKDVCRRCPVTSACLQWALETEERYAVAGGLTATERMAPLLLADPAPPPHVASRGCYVGGCRRPDCCAANTAYQSDLRGRGPATHASRVDSGEQLEIGEAS